MSIETATKVCSVALHKDGQLLGSSELFLEKSHATHLAVMIEQLLGNCQTEMKQLEAIAVSKGPGSYTGLRIGVATAKGLCYALDVPLIAVNTLQAMAHQVPIARDGAEFLCPMIDARRMEVYCMLLNNQFETVSKTQALVVTEDAFDQWSSQGKILFFGDGSGKCRELLEGPNRVFLNDIKPSARTVGTIAQHRHSLGQTEDLAYFEPYYLKEFRTTTPKNKAGLAT